MAKLALTQQLVKDAVCPAEKRKLDFFDTDCKGLMLEVSVRGRKTFYLRYQNERGRTRHIRVADARDVTLSQAKVIVNKYRTQLAMGEDPADKKAELKQVPTVAAFIHDQYLPFIKSYKRSWFTDESRLRCHIEPVWGRKYMDEIRKQDIVELINKYRENHSPSSCNRLLLLVRYMFNLAIRWEVPGVKTNPSAGYPLMQETPRERYLSKQEAATLNEQLNKSTNLMLRYIVPMLILTGARKREVLDALWDDFDLERRMWRIPMSKSGKARYVPLSDGAIQLLQLVPRRAGCPWVFANPKTKKPYRSIFGSWDNARTKAGLADVRIHDLRHSFASFLVNAGRSLYEVQKILGHANAKTTQRYSHLTNGTLIEAANAAMSASGLAFMPQAADAAAAQNCREGVGTTRTERNE